MNIALSVFTRLRSSRTFRLQTYLEHLKLSVPVTKKADKERLYELEKAFHRVNRNKTVLVSIRPIFYLFMFAGLISTIIPLTPLIDDVFKEYKLVLVGGTGTAISYMMVYLLNRYINIYMEDLRTITSHQIAIYEDYDHKDNAKFKEFLEMMF